MKAVTGYKLTDISGNYKYVVIHNDDSGDLLEVFAANDTSKVLWSQSYENIISVDFLNNNSVLSVANFLKPGADTKDSPRVQIQMFSIENGSMLYNNVVDTITPVIPTRSNKVIHVSYKEQANGIIAIIASPTTQSTLYVDKNSYKDIIQPINSKPWNSNPNSIAYAIVVAIICIMTGSVVFVSLKKSKAYDYNEMHAVSVVGLFSWIAFVIFVIVGIATNNFSVYSFAILIEIISGLGLLCSNTYLVGMLIILPD